LNIDYYTDFWKTHSHLPAFPKAVEYGEEAEKNRLHHMAFMQRLLETVEVQAVHISKLNDRIKALEAKPK
jgi:hypothetical protein